MCRNSIWTISILAMFLLSGCAASTQDLIDQAQLTGDWSVVNKRFAAIERREEQQPPSCPLGTRPWCTKSLRKVKCSCMDDSAVRDRFRRMHRNQDRVEREIAR